MTQHRIRLCALGLAALVAAPACKREKMAASPGASRDPEAPAMDPRPAPSRRVAARAPAKKEVVLPIPADVPALRFNVEKLRETAWFKKREPAVRQLLATRSVVAAALMRCDVDPIRNVEGATVGKRFGTRSPDLIAILKIDRKAAEVVACAEKQLRGRRIRVAPQPLAGRPGIVTQNAGRPLALVALRDDQLMVVTGALRARVAAVLQKKERSIASTALYKQVNRQVGPETLFGVIVPGSPGTLGRDLPPVLKRLKTGALLVSLPKGQTAMRVSLRLEDAQAASELSKLLPGLLQMAGARYPGLKDLTRGLQIQSDKSWAYLEFAMEDRAFENLLALVQSLLPLEPPPRETSGMAPAMGMTRGGKTASKATD